MHQRMQFLHHVLKIILVGFMVAGPVWRCPLSII
jgi:hypothetical protein